MALGHLGQFNKIHCDSRPHKVLLNYVLISGHCSDFHRVLNSQTKIMDSTAAKISHSRFAICSNIKM